MVFKRSVGALFLLAQSLAVLFWAYLGYRGFAGVISGPKEDTHTFGLVLVSALLLLIWGLAAATAYCIYRQMKDHEQDEELMQWLLTNADTIKNHNPAFYRSYSITPETELVRHHIVFSLLIVSFRRKTRWLIKGQEPRFASALGASLYTLCYGWWGIPFGVLWTPIAVFKNIAGSATMRVADLWQTAPPGPSTRFEKVKANIAADFRRRLFIE
jgi:hypothetical protein